MTNPQAKKDSMGLVYGFLGVLIFSITLPATRIALTEFDPIFVGLGRAVIASVLSLILLVTTRQPFPHWRFLPSFAIVISGAVVGFPLLSTLAMRDTSASYGAVIIGLLPLATAFFGVWRAGERPSPNFWIFAIAGSGLVVSFALTSGTGTIKFADLALLGAVITASFGYAEGTILARTFGSWQVVCWALVLSFPFILPIVLMHSPSSFATISGNVWLSFLYISCFSMFLGFFAWYRGLFLGGIARVGQLQLLQPFLTIIASAFLVGEAITLRTISFALGVVMCVALGRRNK
ncbi:DMT family transporter [Pseudanabaena sp. FACHB-1998]|uniref:DMT family transporter n=1 Tax=Pseudanabaena sp. FACHB-1998 TaxID=2692858 RepID=UPI001681C075|nr:DMT family transporter [Pseudanabaena sp. FACHB-1998]MBD2177289.1 DMT family transporter [Pseudanabaena sp. FACHB-1998]